MLFAQAIRKAVDEVYPEMSIGYDQPGCSARDGDSVEAVARALAGKNHTPWVRFCGANYGEDCISRIPELLFACLYYRQHIPGKFGFYHESDSYPHTRFFISASCMRVYMSTVYSYGYIGSVFQTQQIINRSVIHIGNRKGVGTEIVWRYKRSSSPVASFKRCLG